MPYAPGYGSGLAAAGRNTNADAFRVFGLTAGLAAQKRQIGLDDTARATATRNSKEDRARKAKQEGFLSTYKAAQGAGEVHLARRVPLH